MSEAKVVAPARSRPVKTALHQAVLDGRLHQVRLLVSKTGINVDCKDVFGRTPLMLACLLDNPEYGFKMLKIFLKAGAYPNVRDNMNRTALSYACMKGHEEIVRHLLKEDILEVDCPDNDGNTPLCHAAFSGKPEIVKELVQLLVRFGNSVDGRNHLGYTPLLLACKYAHYASAYVLLTLANGSPTLRDNEFFLNATDWIKRSGGLHESLVRQRGRTLPMLTTFNRENTLYRQSTSYSPVCKHFTPPSHPLGQSLDSALRLPAVFGYFPLETPEEHWIDGANARLLLVNAIEDTTSNHRARPVSHVSTIPPPTKRRVPATPQLVAAAARHNEAVMVPDMKTLFKMYSDQYEVRSRREKPDILITATSVGEPEGMDECPIHLPVRDTQNTLEIKT